jgi:ADP-ribose pyrophosphatase YjhB (NUDIX family)
MVNSYLIAVGTIFYSEKTNRRLFLLRAQTRSKNTWGLVGGKAQCGETLKQALERETVEEIGFLPCVKRLIPIEKFTSMDEKFEFHTFVSVVEDEFIPKLNKEHSGYAWIDSVSWPKPLHPGLKSMIANEEIMHKLCSIGEKF